MKIKIKQLKSAKDIDDTLYIYKGSKFTLLLKTDISKNYLSVLSFLNKEDIKKIKESSNYPQVIKQTMKELDEYFAGKRKDFDIPLAICVKDFHHRVLQRTILTTYGNVTTYGEIAKEIGAEGKFMPRAVGMAQAKNPIAIIIPCHRVLAYNYSLNGYAFGLQTKEYLLTLEGHKIVDNILKI